MVNHPRFQTALRAFAHTLVRRYEVGDVLYRLSDDVTDVLGAAGAGVSILTDDMLQFVTATSEQVEQVNCTWTTTRRAHAMAATTATAVGRRRR